MNLTPLLKAIKIDTDLRGLGMSCETYDFLIWNQY